MRELSTEAFAFSALPSTDKSGLKPNLLARKISERFPVRLNLQLPAQPAPRETTSREVILPFPKEVFIITIHIGAVPIGDAGFIYSVKDLRNRHEDIEM